MIRISGLRKRFGTLDVLRGVDAHVGKGRITGIVGPNAAGKTTLIKMILGLTRPDAGEILANGTRVNGDESYRAAIGYMPQIARFPSSLTGVELIRMLRGLRGAEAPIDESLIDWFGIRADLGRKLNSLSGGTRQKITAVTAFLFKPDLLILDEPTAGLDPRSSSLLKDRILEDKAKGRTFIITSHIMSELEELADELIFIDEGIVRFSGSIRQMIDQTRQPTLERAVAALMHREAA